MRTRSLLNVCYAVIDDMILNLDADLPDLNRKYAAAFAGYAADLRKPAPAVQTDRCELCYGWYAANTLARIEFDYTADRAARDWSLEREDLLCKACRCELEAEYGTEKPQAFKHWSYLGY
jgi:hypothetical protein